MPIRGGKLISKLFSRFVSVLVAVVILSVTVLPGLSYAETESDQEGTVITDNSEERVAETIENGIVTKATFNKESNTLLIEEEGKEPLILDLGEISEQYVANDVINNDVIKSPSYSSSLAFGTPTTKQDTFINYEYTITHSSPEKWQLRRPNGDSLVKYYYKNVTRTTTNGTSLLKYQTYVENINYYEWKAIGGSLTTLGMSWLSFILSVPTAGAATLTAGLVALGAYGTTLDACVQIHKNANLARGIYFNL